jgi:hypothetical protein
MGRNEIHHNTTGIIEQLAEIRAEEARKAGDKKAVKLFLSNTEFSTEKIASPAGVSESFVKRVKGKMQSKKPS